MTNNENLKNFDDPLYAGLKKKPAEKKKQNPSSTDREPKEKSPVLAILSIVLVVAIAGLGYFIYSAQQKIGELTTNLEVSRQELGQVSETLDESRTHIDELNQGLNESRNQIQTQDRELNRYKGLYQGLRSEQEQATREIQALGIEKAAQTDLNELRGETDQLKGNLEQANTSIEELNTQTARNQEAILETRTELSDEIVLVRKAAESNTGEIAAVKKSLEREYFNFELQEKGGYMKVFEVALSLQDADVRRKQFDLYILADGKVIRKKDQSINEPILFYVTGQTKPYEVVVTRVDDRLVVGHLSIPKG